MTGGTPFPRSPLVLRLGSLLIIGGIWEVAGRTTLGERLPPLSRVISQLVTELGTAEFWNAAAITGTALGLGLGVSLLGGIVFGVVNGALAWLERSTRVFARAMVALPLAPMIPILISMFGLGTSVRVAAITVFALPIIFEYTTAGVRATDRSLTAMARVFHASRWMTYTRVILPSAAPSILAGVRLGVGRSVVGMVVAELVIVSTGLGALLRRAQALFVPEAVFAYVLVFLGVGLLLVRGIGLIEKRTVFWT